MVELVLQNQTFGKDGIRNYQTYATLRSLTLLSPIYAEVFRKSLPLKFSDENVGTKFWYLVFVLHAAFIPVPFDVMNLII